MCDLRRNEALWVSAYPFREKSRYVYLSMYNLQNYLNNIDKLVVKQIN